MSAMSKSRTSGWVDNLTAQDAKRITSGAIRQANSHNRLPFETGNWQGQLLNQTKQYDNIYVRSYLPDSLKDLEYQKNGSVLLKQLPYNLAGEKSPNPDQLFAKMCRQRQTQGDIHLQPFRTSLYVDSASTRPQTQSYSRIFQKRGESLGTNRADELEMDSSSAFNVYLNSGLDNSKTKIPLKSKKGEVTKMRHPKKWSLTLRPSKSPSVPTSHSQNPYMDSLHKIGLTEYNRKRIQTKELHRQ